MLSFTQTRNVYTTTSNGNWGDASIWNTGTSPSNNQTNNSNDIIISNNVTLNDELDIKAGTTLTVTGCDTLIVNGDLIVNNGATITIDLCAVLIVNGNVTNSNDSENFIVNGLLTINGNYHGGNASVLDGSGTMTVTGTLITDGSGLVFGCDNDCNVPGECSVCNTYMLPIELLYFNGKSNEESIRLEWASISENNNDYYEILKYNNGVWDIMSIIDGAGNSDRLINYTTTDASPNVGYNYYKLRQVDFDGESETFKMISVRYSKPTNGKSITIYPNPSKVNESFNVELIGFDREEITLIVTDVLGKTYYKKTTITDKSSFIMPINKELVSGTYLIVTLTKHGLYRKKLIKK